MTILIKILSRVIWEKGLNRTGEDLYKLQVNGSRCSVVVDVGVQVKAGIEEHIKRLGPSPVQCQTLRVAQGVVKHPFPIHRTHSHPSHIRVS